jgi:hypothetical protein
VLSEPHLLLEYNPELGILPTEDLELTSSNNPRVEYYYLDFIINNVSQCIMLLLVHTYQQAKTGALEGWMNVASML